VIILSRFNVVNRAYSKEYVFDEYKINQFTGVQNQFILNNLGCTLMNTFLNPRAQSKKNAGLKDNP